MLAKKILWKIPVSERDYAGTNGGIVGGRDWEWRLDATFPSSNPEFDPTLANPMEELLIIVDAVATSAPDMRVFQQISISSPTNIKHPIFKNVNEFQTMVTYIPKPLEEIITAIKQRELEANRDIRLIANYDKTLMFYGTIQKKIGIDTLTSNEQKVDTRINEVQACAAANDENVRRLIAIAENNAIAENEKQVFDINSGWHETQEWITMIDIPFNELNL